MQNTWYTQPIGYRKTQAHEVPCYLYYRYPGIHNPVQLQILQIVILVFHKADKWIIVQKILAEYQDLAWLLTGFINRDLIDSILVSSTFKFGIDKGLGHFPGEILIYKPGGDT